MKIKELTSEDLDILTGYMDGERRLMDKYEIEIDEIEELALDQGVERCPECGWYVETTELVPVDGDGEPDGYCCNCRPPGLDLRDDEDEEENES